MLANDVPFFILQCNHEGCKLLMNHEGVEGRAECGETLDA